MEDGKEIRLSIEELEATLKIAKLLTSEEVVHAAWIEPGEMVIKAVQ